MTILNALEYRYCFSFWTCQKHVVWFTDPAPTIYWHIKKLKKKQTVESNLSIYAKTKYDPMKADFVCLAMSET